VLQAYQTIIATLPRTAPRQLLEDICGQLAELHAEISDILESFTKTQNANANESHFERHIQNSNPESISESEHGFREKNEASGSAAETDNVRSLPKRDLPLSIVLDACPNLLEIVQSGEIRHWRDLLAAAELGRTMLGISRSAWQDAQGVMGEVQAAIALAAIYQRSGQINSAGGYLRSLTDKAREGKFSTWPMIMALLRAKLDENKRRQSEAAGNAGGAPRLEFSDSLVKSLQKLKPLP
jgi:replication initiation protein RepC